MNQEQPVKPSNNMFMAPTPNSQQQSRLRMMKINQPSMSQLAMPISISCSNGAAENSSKNDENNQGRQHQHEDDDEVFSSAANFSSFSEGAQGQLSQQNGGGGIRKGHPMLIAG